MAKYIIKKIFDCSCIKKKKDNLIFNYEIIWTAEFGKT